VKLRFHGAAGRVTGSCHVVECGGRTLLLDCGLVQGGAREEELNRAPLPVDPARIDAVVLSHAHIDHSGRLPLLAKSGYRGPVYAQRATTDLCEIMLRDAAYLQEKDAVTENRKRERKGLAPVAALYSTDDAARAMRQVESLPYDEIRGILPGVQLRFRDAGHILGSSIVELWLSEGGTRRKLVYSGDLGQPNTPILRDPTVVRDADAVLLESTYGDRLHRSRESTLEEMRRILTLARQDGGNVLIPAFAVGRTQEMLYLFGEHYHDWGLDQWRICLDSPLAIQATEVYARHAELHDEDAMRLWRERGAELLPNLELLRTPQQSRALNRARSGAIIIAASGMCEGGRIRHHLKNHVWRKGCHVVIVGYQAQGTVGRQLVDGSAYISLWGEAIRVAATVHTVGGFSAHADQAHLLDWYGSFGLRPPVWLVHGEDAPRAALAEAIRKRFAVVARQPAAGDRVDLAALPALAGAPDEPAGPPRRAARRRSTRRQG
jgi:metallo-beta-lactamase family protein